LLHRARVECPVLTSSRHEESESSINDGGAVNSMQAREKREAFQVRAGAQRYFAEDLKTIQRRHELLSSWLHLFIKEKVVDGVSTIDRAPLRGE
jgi:hypothetical protein